jgi:putative flippase GtrA
VKQELLSFTAIGMAGLCVDTAALYLSLALGLNLYSGRVISYLVAATFTWAMNRRFTFATTDRTAPFKQWLRFLAANTVGALANYSIYAALVTWVPLIAAWPVLGVAAGSLAGLAFNFTASRQWVFKAGNSYPASGRTHGNG